jgi:putative tryptophan/tyrosine transport system substrate-binding protein
MIGFLGSAARATIRPGNWVGFHQGLADAGYIEGRNLAIEYRWADGRNEVLPALAADLVRQRVAVIASMTTAPCALAAKAATQAIPIVFLVGADPVAIGIVASLSHPGGNLTGVTSLVGELVAKRLQMLHEVVPSADPIALLIDPTGVANEASQGEVAAGRLGVRLVVVNRPGRERSFRAVDGFQYKPDRGRVDSDQRGGRRCDGGSSWQGSVARWPGHSPRGRSGASGCDGSGCCSPRQARRKRTP